MRTMMRSMQRRRRGIAAGLMVCLSLWSVRPACAHNAAVHQGMAARAYQIMRFVDRASRSNQTLGVPPQGVSAAQWKTFQHDIATARKKLDTLAGDPAPGDLSNKGASDALATAAAAPDDHKDDTHLFVKASSVLGAGAANKVVDEAIKAGVAALLIPIVCLASCLANLFGFGGDTCEECVKNAKNLANKTPTPDDLLNLIPGIGDITSSQFTGLWHFINMSSSPLVENAFDDHQGILYEAAGPDQVPGAIDLAIMAGTDLIGLSVNPDKSDGVKHYEIVNPGDGFPDGDTYKGSVKRSNAEWQKYPMGHTPFTSVDNLALYGWRQFRDNGHDLANLGFPLHAMGDATVPMHVTGTTSYGHRPFEDAQEQLWNNGKLTAALSDERILQAAYRYRQEILQWRAKGHAGDIPVRRLVREVARHTFDYSRAKQAQTLLTSPLKPWPFNDAASLLWHTVSENDANTLYRDRSDAVALVAPLIEDGIAAQLAFLMSAVEANGIVQNAPSPLPLDGLPQTAPARLAVVTPDAPNKFVLAGAGAPSALESAARVEYARMAQQLVAGKASPAEYLFRVRSLTRKVRAAVAQGKTSPNAIANYQTIPRGQKLPKAPSAGNERRVQPHRHDAFPQVRVSARPEHAPAAKDRLRLHQSRPRFRRVAGGWRDE